MVTEEREKGNPGLVAFHKSGKAVTWPLARMSDLCDDDLRVHWHKKEGVNGTRDEGRKAKRGVVEDGGWGSALPLVP
jgi:hypothetical protein